MLEINLLSRYGASYHLQDFCTQFNRLNIGIIGAAQTTIASTTWTAPALNAESSYDVGVLFWTYLDNPDTLSRPQNNVLGVMSRD